MESLASSSPATRGGTLLVVFSPIRWSDELLNYLTAHAGEFDRIVGIYVIERRLIQRRARKWMTEGWLGSDATRTVVETIMSDFHQRADQYFQQLESAVGRPVERQILENEIVGGVLEIARRFDARRIVLVRRVKPRWLRRWLKTEGEQLAARAPCPVVSIEPEA